MPETFVEEKYFSSFTNVVDGTYRIQVFGVTTGSYYLDSRSFDTAGNFNGSQIRTGTIVAGKSVTLSLTHSSLAVSPDNATVNLNKYSILARQKAFAKSDIAISAKITPLDKSKIMLKSNFQLMIGGIPGFSLSIPASQFKVLPHRRERDWDRGRHDRDKDEPVHFVYRHDETEIFISTSGEIEIGIHDASFSTPDPSQFGNVRIEIDSTIADTNAKLNCHEEFCSLLRQDLGQRLNH